MIEVWAFIKQVVMMLNTITAIYHKLRHNMEIKHTIRDMLDRFIRYLTEFLSCGKKWALKCVYKYPKEALHCNSLDEYLYRVNVKCGCANNIIVHATVIRDRMTGFGEVDFNESIEVIKMLFKTTRDLLNSSVNVVPYTKMDEFNLYIYQSENTLQSINQATV